MTAVARASSNYKRQTYPPVREDYDRKCLVEKNAGRESEGARRQEELIGGKPPIVK
jgi:hypothetical protein